MLQQKNAKNCFRPGLIMSAILALALMVATPTSATALPVTGGDSFSAGCRTLQDQANKLLNEYKAKGTTGARMREIINELQNLNGDWKAVGCQTVFGNIVRTIPTSPSHPRVPTRPVVPPHPPVVR